jgi:GNAT superfamily N-acetyltransferase
MQVTIERAKPDEASFTEVFELLLHLHAAGGYADLDVNKASDNCFRVIEEGMVFVARSEDGKAVGTLALTELSFWYSQETFLQDAWFFVLPEFRAGNVGVELMKAAREAAEEKSKIAFVTVNNPDRRPKKTRMTIESQVAGYAPLGHTTRIS